MIIVFTCLLSLQDYFASGGMSRLGDTPIFPNERPNLKNVVGSMFIRPAENGGDHSVTQGLYMLPTYI